MTDEERSVTNEDREGSTNAEYLAIEAAVLETARGRWFLAEFARRNRHADTERVIEAVDRLKDDTLPGRAAQVMDHLHVHLGAVTAVLEEARSEIARLPPVDRLGLSPLHPDVPLSATDADGLKRIARTLKALQSVEGRLRALRTICDPDSANTDGVAARPPVSNHPSFLM